MDKQSLLTFERIARRAYLFSDEEVKLGPVDHPFDTRDIHSALPGHIKSLFDDGYYSQATFEAFKYLDKEVARLSNISESGFKLMMAAFQNESPAISLTDLRSQSEKDEQKGYQFMFSGSVLAIRNPRGHEYRISDSIDECLDHLSLVSLLLRRLEKAGYSINAASTRR